MLRVNAGDIVVFNGLPSAAQFDVLEVNGFCIKVREHGTDYQHQYSDVSLVHKVIKKSTK